MQFKQLLFSSFFLIFFIKTQSQTNKIKDFKEFSIENTSIRAIKAVNDSTLWFAGSNGRYGKIIHNKITLDSIKHGAKNLNFRSIAFNGKHIFILSIENPAILYKIDPFKDPTDSPVIVYQENHQNVFYDAMTFFDEQNGIAMGDPTDGCLSVILTNDGGHTWKKLNCENLPKIVEGEAAFAASNSNIAVSKQKAWMVTGGKKSRVFYSHDLGHHWKVAETPVIQGGKMTGIYTVDFYNKNKGIIMGGNWEEKSNTRATKATTEDGGETWQLIANDQMPAYISCVKYVPGSKGKEIIAVSTEGIYFSENGGMSWRKISSKGYFSIAFVNKHTAWLSGSNKIAKIQFNQ